MNKENARDYLPLVQALAEGKVIQFNTNTLTEPNWIDVDRLLDSNPAHGYRIKPEPKEVWLVVDGDKDGTYMSFDDEKEARKYANGDHIALYREVIE